MVLTQLFLRNTSLIYVALVKSARMDGVNTVAMFFSIAAYYCDKLQVDRFIKSMEEVEGCEGPG